jgi:hypothetical protein
MRPSCIYVLYHFIIGSSLPRYSPAKGLVCLKYKRTPNGKENVKQTSS